jgi:hypothetical protein
MPSRRINDTGCVDRIESRIQVRLAARQSAAQPRTFDQLARRDGPLLAKGAGCELTGLRATLRPNKNYAVIRAKVPQPGPLLGWRKLPRVQPVPQDGVEPGVVWRHGKRYSLSAIGNLSADSVAMRRNCREYHRDSPAPIKVPQMDHRCHALPTGDSRRALPYVEESAFVVSARARLHIVFSDLTGEERQCGSHYTQALQL